MSVLLFGVSHRSAPVSVLEQLSTDESDQAKIVDQVLQSSLVTEAMVLSTCNRVEVYAVVEAFHGGLSVIGQVLSEHSGMSLGDLTKYAYVRYAEAAVEHLFAVTSGLDSAVIGEQQVLGQVRRAYAAAEANQTVGRTLHELAQRALSVGKRVHSETGIDAAGASVVSVALDMANAKLPGGLAARTAVVIGAGSMGALAAAHLVRAGIGRVHVVNRSLPRAERLAQNLRDQGVEADAFPFDHIPPVLADADVVVTCTGAVRPVVSLADVHRGLAPGAPKPQQLVDLRPGHAPRRRPRRCGPARRVHVVDMDRIQREPAAAPPPPTPRPPARSSPPRSPTTWPASGWPRSRPTVTALRQRAADVVEAELLRLDNRLPGPGGSRTATRSPAPCAASSTSSCTPRRCASSNWPAHRAATATPRRCVSCSNSTRRPSTPWPVANCRW